MRNKIFALAMFICLVMTACTKSDIKKETTKKSDNESASNSVSEVNTLKVKNAEISDKMQIFEIDIVYCDSYILIFKDYFGLFVYSLETNQIINSLDVGYINCDSIQGDNACFSVTYDNGNIVELFTENDHYYFDWVKNKLYTDYAISNHSEDKNDNLKVPQIKSELKYTPISINYVEYNGGKLFLTCSGEEDILNNLSYVVENEDGMVFRSNYIFRKL